MTALVFVDTNVLLYKVDGTEPGKQSRAAEWIHQLWRERAGRTSLQVLCEFYVNVTRKLKPGMSREDAWDEVEGYLTWQPVPVDAAVVRQAREIERRHRLSWWDCQIVAAAQMQGCDMLLTEDLQDGMRIAGLVVRNPFVYLANEALAPYEEAPQARPVHRGRGRPAKRAVLI
jgi:predicted nucleic acid-binding protein